MYTLLENGFPTQEFQSLEDAVAFVQRKYCTPYKPHLNEQVEFVSYHTVVEIKEYTKVLVPQPQVVRL